MFCSVSCEGDEAVFLRVQSTAAESRAMTATPQKMSSICRRECLKEEETKNRGYGVRLIKRTLERNTPSVHFHTTQLSKSTTVHSGNREQVNAEVLVINDATEPQSHKDSRVSTVHYFLQKELKSTFQP